MKFPLYRRISVCRVRLGRVRGHPNRKENIGDIIWRTATRAAPCGCYSRKIRKGCEESQYHYEALIPFLSKNGYNKLNTLLAYMREGI